MTLLEDVNAAINKDYERIHFMNLNGVTVVSNDVEDVTRWTNVYRAILERDGEYVAVEYEEGATEYQDDVEHNAIAYNVKPVEVTITKYVEV